MNAETAVECLQVFSINHTFTIAKKIRNNRNKKTSFSRQSLISEMRLLKSYKLYIIKKEEIWI